MSDYDDDDLDNDDELDDDEGSARLGKLLSGAAAFASALIGWLQANPGWSAEDKATQTGDDCITQGDVASTLDSADSQNAHVVFVAEDGSCPDCSDLDSNTYSTDEADGVIPVHNGCGCGWEIEGAA